MKLARSSCKASLSIIHWRQSSNKDGELNIIIQMRYERLLNCAL